VERVTFKKKTGKVISFLTGELDVKDHKGLSIMKDDIKMNIEIGCTSVVEACENGV
jgi:hypothetical protein